MFGFLKSFTVFVSFTLLMTTIYGCEPLRKKFRREKKEKKDLGFVPVLDPVDYAPARVSAKERYSYHYSLWKVWEKELAQNYINDNNKKSDKRQNYLLTQMITHLTEMKRWINPQKAEEMDKPLSELYKLQKEYDKADALRSRFKMKSLLSRTSRMIRDNFSPLVIEEHYIN